MSADTDGVHSSVTAIENMEAACARFASALVERLPQVESEIRQITALLEDRALELRRRIADLSDNASPGEEDNEDGGDASWKRQQAEEAAEELVAVEQRICRLSEVAAPYAC